MRQQRKIADLQHIRIVPTSRRGVLGPLIIGQNVGSNARPEWLNILSSSPAVAKSRRPGRWISTAPIAQGKEDLVRDRLESLCHGLITRLRRQIIVKTIIILEIIYLPIRLSLGINQLITECTGAMLVSKFPSIAVQAEQQAHFVYLLCKPLNAVRESFWVSDDFMSYIRPSDLPTIIQIHSIIASAGQSSGNQRFGLVQYEGFSQVASEMIPRIPAHLRCYTQTIRYTRYCGHKGQQQENNRGDTHREWQMRES